MQRRRKKKAGTPPPADELEVGTSGIVASSSSSNDWPLSPRGKPSHLEGGPPEKGPDSEVAPEPRGPRRPGRRSEPEIPRPAVAWGNVIRDTFKIPDPAALARRLRDELTLGDENRTSYATVLEALDKAARNLDDAGRLHRAAKVEEVRYRLDSEGNLEILRREASKKLRAEYQAKLRKSPTLQDIEDTILDNWPSEYRALLERRAELHGAARSLEILVRAWGSRCADLRIMAEHAARTTGR